MYFSFRQVATLLKPVKMAATTANANKTDRKISGISCICRINRNNKRIIQLVYLFKHICVELCKITSNYVESIMPIAGGWHGNQCRQQKLTRPHTYVNKYIY